MNMVQASTLAILGLIIVVGVTFFLKMSSGKKEEESLPTELSEEALERLKEIRQNIRNEDYDKIVEATDSSNKLSQMIDDILKNSPKEVEKKKAKLGLGEAVGVGSLITNLINLNRQKQNDNRMVYAQSSRIRKGHFPRLR